MRTRRPLHPLTLAVVLMAMILLSCSTNTSSTSTAAPPAADAAPQALAHFDQIKFGMFIHWGLYALPAGEWKGSFRIVFDRAGEPPAIQDRTWSGSSSDGTEQGPGAQHPGK